MFNTVCKYVYFSNVMFIKLFMKISFAFPKCYVQLSGSLHSAFFDFLTLIIHFLLVPIKLYPTVATLLMCNQNFVYNRIEIN